MNATLHIRARKHGHSYGDGTYADTTICGTFGVETTGIWDRVTCMDCATETGRLPSDGVNPAPSLYSNGRGLVKGQVQLCLGCFKSGTEFDTGCGATILDRGERFICGNLYNPHDCDVPHAHPADSEPETPCSCPVLRKEHGRYAQNPARESVGR